MKQLLNARADISRARCGHAYVDQLTEEELETGNAALGIDDMDREDAPQRACLRSLHGWAGYGDRVIADSGVRYVWHEARVLDGLEITQVYGYLLCPQTGRVLVQDDGGVFNLPGGTPEPEDGGDLVATLVREAFEENQVRVGVTAYLGYQEVHRPERAVYAQVRMAGVIEEFAAPAPDPDGGRVYRRLMTSLEAAPRVLGWGAPAVAQAEAAARVARSGWGLPVDAPAAPGYAD